MALRGNLSLEVNNPITTSQMGKMAPIIAASPADMYFTPQVLNPLLSIKFKRANKSNGLHSFPFGKGAPIIKK